MKIFSFITLMFFFNSYAASDINVHHLTPGMNTKFVRLESTGFSDSLVAPKWYFYLGFDHVQTPLVKIISSGKSQITPIVDNMQSLEFGMGYRLLPRLSASFAAIGHHNNVLGDGVKYMLGDSRLVFNILLTRPLSRDESDLNKFSFSIVPTLTLPTGKLGSFVSDAGVGYGGKFVGEYNAGWARLVANAGFMRSSHAVYLNADYRTKIPYGIGALIPLSRIVGINAEYEGAFVPSSSKFENLSEFYLGARVKPTDHWVLQMGGSLGQFKSGGSASDYRLIAMAKFTPSSKILPAIVAVPELVRECPTGLITFKNDSLELTSISIDRLQKFVSSLEQNILTSIDIYGHASPVGSKKHNNYLADNRAIVTKNYLVSQGLSQELIQVKGFSDERAPGGDFTDFELKMDAWRRAELICHYKK